MATGGEGADASMAQQLRSSSPASGHVGAGETQQHATAGASRGFGASVTRTSSTGFGLQSFITIVF